MSTTATRLMTTEEFLAMPDDGVERWLNKGVLYEAGSGGTPRTIRNRFHSQLMAYLSHLIRVWIDTRSEPRGSVFCGEAGCRLAEDPATTVGIDVVYISPDMARSQSDETTLLEGIPSLVAEILSPSDTLRDIREKIDVYLGAGVPHVWTVEPTDRAVRVYRPGMEPETFHPPAELTAESELPGFRLSLARLFDA